MIINRQPDQLSLLGNLNHLVLQTEGASEEVTMQVWLGTAGASSPIVTHTYKANADGLIDINLQDIVKAHLAFGFPEDPTEPYQQTGIARSFSVGLSSSLTETSFSFTVLRAGVSALADSVENFLTQNFLTWQPTLKPVTYYTPEFLTYYATVACKMKCTAYMSDGTEHDLLLATFDAGACKTVPVGYQVISGMIDELHSYHDVWVEDMEGERLTYIQRYYASSVKSEEEVWILFENSLGGIDTFRAYGDSENTADHEHQVATMDDESSEYRVDVKRKYKKSTGWLDNYERRWLLDFFPSLGKYICDPVVRKIVVTDSDVNYSVKDLPSEYTFTYQYADAKPYLNLPRTDVSLQEMQIDIPDVASFTIAPRLVEFQRPLLSAGALFPVQNPYSEKWGATTLAEIAGYLSEGLMQLSGTYGKDHYLSRLVNDVANGHITFRQGLTALFAVTDTLRSNDYTGEGLFDKGFGIWNQTERATGATYSHAVVDFLTVRLKAFFAQLELREISYVGGNFVFSAAGSKIYHVEWMTEDNHIIDKQSGYVAETGAHGVIHHFRCWFFSDDGTTATMNKWKVGDQAQCRTFDIEPGVHNNVQNRFFWRLVTAVGKSIIPTLTADQDGYGKEFQYADLSNVTGEHALDSSGSTPDAASSVILEDYPEAGDKIVQIGNWTDSTRQGMMYLQVCGTLAFYMFEGVGRRHFEIPAPSIRISPELGNIFKGTFISSAGEDDLEVNIRNITEQLNDVQQQADKRFDIWFGAYEPMPQQPGDTPNYPASEWDTPQLRQLHTQDIFTDTRKEAASDTAGRAWRYEAVADENDPQTIYFLWKEVTDVDTIAVKEQLVDVASDGKLSGGAEKSRVFTDWMRCVDEYNKYYAQRTLYSVSTEFTAYQTAFLALGAYLNNGVSLQLNQETGQYEVPLWISSSSNGMSVTTDIDAGVWRSTWNAYYQAVTNLANAIRQAAKNQVDDLADDGIISAGYEKSQLLTEWMRAVENYNSAIANSSLYTSGYTISDVPTVSTDDLTTAMKALALMLNGGDPTDSTAVAAFDLSSYIRSASPVRPAWIGSNLGQDTSLATLTVSVYQNTWNNFYAALAELNSIRMKKLVMGVNATFENTGSSLVMRVKGTELTLYDHQDGSGATVKGLTTVTSELTVAYGTVSSKVSTLEGDYSTLNQTVSSISSRVSTVEGNYSTLNQTVSSISSRVSTVEGKTADMSIYVTRDTNGVITNAHIGADNVGFTFSNQWTVKAKDSGGTERTVMTLTPSGDLSIAGKFHGEFDDNIVFGDGTKKMYIRPNQSYGAELIGKDDDGNTVLSFGFTSGTIPLNGSLTTVSKARLNLKYYASGSEIYSMDLDPTGLSFSNGSHYTVTGAQAESIYADVYYVRTSGSGGNGTWAQGASGTFKSSDSPAKTITVKFGIITNIS